MMRAAAFVVLVLGWSTGAVYAQTVGVKDLSIQMGPEFIKFQARVSQANLPVGDAVFQGVTVNLYDQSTGGQVICTQELMNTNGGKQIPVTNGILNVEIGRAMDCSSGKSFHEEVAGRSPMYLEIVLITKNSEGGSTPNTLSPRIQFGTVPYAIKASYATHTNDAQIARIADQSLYAHRVSADPDVENAQSSANGYSGANGYFDFATPAEETAVGGHVVWAPNLGADNSLTIASGLPDNNQQLDNFTIKSNHTVINGSLEVTNGIEMTGSIDKAKQLISDNNETRSVEDIKESEGKIYESEQKILAGEGRISDLETMTNRLNNNLHNFNGPAIAHGNNVQENNPQNNCACFARNGRGYKRVSKPCTANSYPFACFKPAVGQVGFDWQITTTTGKWEEGFSACQQFGAEYYFASPKNSNEDFRLRLMMGSVDSVWINLIDKEKEGYWVPGNSISERIVQLERSSSQISSSPSDNSIVLSGSVRIDGSLLGDTVINGALSTHGDISTNRIINIDSIGGKNNNTDPVAVLSPLDLRQNVTAKSISVTGDVQTSANLIAGGEIRGSEIRGRIDGTYIKKGTTSVPWFRFAEVTISESSAIPRIACTTYSSSDYNAVISSFDVRNGDINENSRNGVSIFKMKTTIVNGYICVEGNFKSDGAEEEIWVQLLLINRNLFIGG